MAIGLALTGFIAYYTAGVLENMLMTNPAAFQSIQPLFFVLIIVLLERSFSILEIRWPRWVEAVPAYTVGSLGAFWTIQRVAIMVGGMIR